jgi:lysozyme
LSACQVPSPSLVASASPLPAASISPKPTPTPRPTTAPNENICPTTSAQNGIDVSDDQPGTDWSSVQVAGKKFAFVKATEGTSFTNPDFSADWTALKTLGVTRGAYHYFHPDLDPISQSDYFLSAIGTLAASDLPPVLDWEETDGVSVATEIANALLWLARVESMSGKVPMIYVDPSFWNALGNPVQFARYPLFIANYEVSCPEIPPPWNTWTFWQQGSGTVAGVKAIVDLDLFNGNQAQLTHFAQTGL